MCHGLELFWVPLCWEAALHRSPSDAYMQKEASWKAEGHFIRVHSPGSPRQGAPGQSDPEADGIIRTKAPGLSQILPQMWWELRLVPQVSQTHTMHDSVAATRPRFRRACSSLACGHAHPGLCLWEAHASPFCGAWESCFGGREAALPGVSALRFLLFPGIRSVSSLTLGSSLRISKPTVPHENPPRMAVAGGGLLGSLSSEGPARGQSVQLLALVPTACQLSSATQPVLPGAHVGLPGPPQGSPSPCTCPVLRAK